MNILVRVSYLHSFQDRRDFEKRCYNLEDGICQTCKKAVLYFCSIPITKNLEKGSILEIQMHLCAFHFIIRVRTQQQRATCLQSSKVPLAYPYLYN